MKISQGRGVLAFSLATLCAAPLTACSSDALDPSEQSTGSESSASQHLISHESGLAMVAQFNSARSRFATALARGLGSETRYAPDAVREVLEQDGARKAFASLGLNADGSTTITLRVLDGTGRFLPEALANGQITDASEAGALLDRVEDDDDGAARSLVSASDGTLIQGWKYDASAFKAVASQREADSVSFALGQNALGEPTVVMLAHTVVFSAAPMAADQGYPSPPY